VGAVDRQGRAAPPEAAAHDRPLFRVLRRGQRQRALRLPLAEVIWISCCRTFLWSTMAVGWAFLHERFCGRRAVTERYTSFMSGLRGVEHHLSGHADRSQLREQFSPFFLWHAAHACRCPDPPGDSPCSGTANEADPFGVAFAGHCRKSIVVGRERPNTLGRTIRRFRARVPDGLVSAYLGDHRRAALIQATAVHSADRFSGCWFCRRCHTQRVLSRHERHNRLLGGIGLDTRAPYVGPWALCSRCGGPSTSLRRSCPAINT
jgi:hypothetical protein